MNNDRKRTSARRWAALLVALGTGGTMLSACQGRFKDAFVGGSKDFLSATLADPNTTQLVLERFGLEPGEE